MKLEKKHIFPYLPDLKILWEGDGKITPITLNDHDMESEDYDEDSFSLCSVMYSIENQNDEGVGFRLILRPLSDLTKEIEYNGEKFEFANTYEIEPNYTVEDYINDNHGLEPIDMPYHIFERMLAFHFDVFGLIEKGLAIDINTL